MELLMLLMLPIVLLYLLPTWIAFGNRHRNLPAMALLNFLTGWSLIGWLAALGFAVWPGQQIKA